MNSCPLNYEQREKVIEDALVSFFNKLRPDLLLNKIAKSDLLKSLDMLNENTNIFKFRTNNVTYSFSHSFDEKNSVVCIFGGEREPYFHVKHKMSENSSWILACIDLSNVITILKKVKTEKQKEFQPSLF